VVQVVGLQAVALAQTTPPGQSEAVEVFLHPAAPAVTPSQALACSLPLSHCPAKSLAFVHAEPHAVPAAAGRQAPAPLHPPAMQLAVDVGHAASGAPSGAFLQVPEPSTLQC
jgi:hypothetical protein